MRAIALTAILAGDPIETEVIGYPLLLARCMRRETILRMKRRSPMLSEYRWTSLHGYCEAFPFIAEWLPDRIVVAGWRHPRYDNGLIDLRPGDFDRPIYLTLGDEIAYWICAEDGDDAVRVKLRYL